MWRREKRAVMRCSQTERSGFCTKCQWTQSTLLLEGETTQTENWGFILQWSQSRDWTHAQTHARRHTQNENPKNKMRNDSSLWMSEGNEYKVSCTKDTSNMTIWTYEHINPHILMSSYSSSLKWDYNIEFKTKSHRASRKPTFNQTLSIHRPAPLYYHLTLILHIHN